MYAICTAKNTQVDADYAIYNKYSVNLYNENHNNAQVNANIKLIMNYQQKLCYAFL